MQSSTETKSPRYVAALEADIKPCNIFVDLQDALGQLGVKGGLL